MTRPSDLKQAELRKIQAMGDGRRAEAAALAERVRKGAEVPSALAAKVREALAGDIEIWRHGHQVGDRVLVCAAQWLANCTRPGDVLARYGGEEFVVMLADEELSQAEARFTGVLAEISRSHYTYRPTKLYIRPRTREKIESSLPKPNVVCGSP